MTTIIYDHKNKQVAVDSRATAGSTIMTDSAIKYREKDGVMWFFCGKTGEQEAFMNSFKELTSALDFIDVTALFVENKNTYLATVEDGVYRSCLIDFSDSIGSGCEFALAAVDLGKDAKGAVEYAMTRDLYTGGKVHVYDIEKGEFI